MERERWPSVGHIWLTLPVAQIRMHREAVHRTCIAIALLFAIASVLGAHAQHSSPPNVYLPVEVTPPGPAVPAMTPDEQSKLKKELTAVRDRQATGARGKQVEKQMEPKKP